MPHAHTQFAGLLVILEGNFSQEEQKTHVDTSRVLLGALSLKSDCFGDNVLVTKYVSMALRTIIDNKQTWVNVALSRIRDLDRFVFLLNWLVVRKLQN